MIYPILLLLKDGTGMYAAYCQERTIRHDGVTHDEDVYQLEKYVDV